MEEVTVQGEMTPQEALHELDRLVRLFDMFKSAQRVIVAMFEAQNKKSALEHANADLLAALATQEEVLAKLQEDYTKTKNLWELERANAIEATEAACLEVKEKYRKEIEGLEAKISDRGGALKKIEADFVAIRDEQNRQLTDIEGRAQEAESRIAAAESALAELKGKL